MAILAVGVFFVLVAADVIPSRDEYSRLWWALSREGHRLKLAQDYLATRTVVGMPLEDVRDDLGAPSWSKDYFEYAVSSEGLGTPCDTCVPRYDGTPILQVWFRGKDRTVSELTAPTLWSPETATEFSSSEWQSLARFPGRRQPLANALIRDQSMRGATRADVRRALGDPDFAELHWEFLLQGSGSGATTLEISLDMSDRVVSARIISD